ncbi:MAG: M56 family metallopeptidase [Planctomycetota bacterium]|nr:M56 family metallopeptidase [Planctomycetota bacterium]
MNLNVLIDPVFTGGLCLTLLHSLWQVGLIAIVVTLLERLWKRTSAERSYFLHTTGLVCSFVALPITWLLVDAGGDPGSASASPAFMISEVVETGMKPESKANIPLNPRVILQSQHTSEIADSNAASLQPSPTEVSPPGATGAEFVPPASWQILATWIVALYVTGVIAMFSRLAIAIGKANRLAMIARPVSDASILAMVKGLTQKWSMKVEPVLALAEQVVVPQVVGLLRPTILLPASALSGLSVDELELILTHEVAHIRRYDMWVALIQRLAESLLFFNPAVWYLNRRISELREYCCDDIACQSDKTDSPPTHVRYALALLRVVELGHPKAAVHPQLAALAASGRTPSELRRRVTRLFGEPIQEPLRLSRGGFLICGVLVLLLITGPVFLPVSRLNGLASEVVAEDNKTANAAASKFRLNVVDPTGAPVANANIEIRGNQSINARQIEQGVFVKDGRYGVIVSTDEHGKLVLNWTHTAGHINFNIEQPGYGPYRAAWDPQLMPIEFTAELDSAWSVGGIVVDEASEPIADAEISLSIEFKKPPGDTSQHGAGARTKTDAEGKWRYDLVPVSTDKDYVFVSVDHPDYQPQRQPLPRSEYEIKVKESPSRRIPLKSGVTIAGQVTDEAGNPIEGAIVRSKFVNEIREAKSDPQGRYSLVGCEPRMTRIVAFAKGRAMELQEVLADPGMKPVNFMMKAGAHVRIRIVDEQGAGLSKAIVHFQRWRGHLDYFEFNHVNKYADENGVWEWDEAPLDEFKADICHPTGMQLSSRPIVARAEEYVFNPPPALVMSGAATDAKSKLPIPAFRVVQGMRDAPGLSLGEYWSQRDSIQFADGIYRVASHREAPAHMLRIEADGYRNAVSRDIKMDEGTITIDFELQPAADVWSSVLTPSGVPAADAKIAIGIKGDRITIRNGDIRDRETRATRIVSNQDGRFRVPDLDTPFHVVVIHAEGFVYLKSKDGRIPETITLNAWARAEGSFRVGKQPLPSVPIGISGGLYSYEESGPFVSTRTEGKTGPDGRYQFDRIVPGTYRIGRDITFMVDNGATEVTSSQRVPVEYFAGKTTTLNLGGTGRAVVGKFVPPADYPDVVLWNFASIDASLNLETPAIPKSAPLDKDAPDYPVRMEAWLATGEGQAYIAALQTRDMEVAKHPESTASIDRDGSFRIDDMSSGEYELILRFNRNQSLTLRTFQFTVPKVEGDVQPEPLNLGEIPLVKNMDSP